MAFQYVGQGQFDFAIDQPKIAVATVNGRSLCHGTSRVHGADNIFEVQIDEGHLLIARLIELTDIGTGCTLNQVIELRCDDGESSFVVEVVVDHDLR